MLYGAHWYTRFTGKRPVLDLGPGRCWFTKQNLKDIIAVDNSPELVEHYRRLGVQILLGNAYEIPFPAAYFEGVFCCWLLEHLAEPARAVGEIHRVLKPAGYACLIVPSANDLVAFYDDYNHVRPFTVASLKQLAENAKFSSAHIEYLPWSRGVGLVLRFFGPGAGRQFLSFSESLLRHLGLLNRKHLMLEAWK